MGRTATMMRMARTTLLDQRGNTKRGLRSIMVRAKKGEKGRRRMPGGVPGFVERCTKRVADSTRGWEGRQENREVDFRMGAARLSGALITPKTAPVGAKALSPWHARTR